MLVEVSVGRKISCVVSFWVSCKEGEDTLRPLKHTRTATLNKGRDGMLNLFLVPSLLFV